MSISLSSKIHVLGSLFWIAAGYASAQDFPARPLTVTLPNASGIVDAHMLEFARIAAKYLGQTINVRRHPGHNQLGLGDYLLAARPDGYSLYLLTIAAYRTPHLARVPWHPVNDFTYIIGLAGYTYGVVVKSDSPFRTLRDLIKFAKSNPGQLRFAAYPHTGTAHLAMIELGFKADARLLHVPGTIPDSMKALAEGRISAIASSTVWAPQVESGALRLIATFGEQRSRWKVPTAREQGFDIISYSPFGIAAPKGLDPKVAKRLHDVFKQAVDDPEHKGLLENLGLVYWYKSGDDYADWAVDQLEFQRRLIAHTTGVGTN